ncbi:MAG: DNA polymerase Y family protein [Pseudomonadota bacterium]
MIVVQTVKNAQRIVAHEPGAVNGQVSLEQKLGDARALVPDLDVYPAAPHEDAALLEQIGRWCDRYTPLVGLSGTDGLMMDISGCAHLFGGEAEMIEMLRARLRGQGFNLRLGVADTIGAAWGLARFGTQPAALSGGDLAPLLALPLEALRIDEKTVLALRRLGLRRIGCLTPLPRAPLTTRFGAGLLQRLDQALGRAAESLMPLTPPVDITAEKAFFDPITHADDITRSITLLAQTLVPLLEARDQGARALELRLFRVDGHRQHLIVEAAHPLRDPARIAALFRERIAGLAVDIDAGFGFDLVKLAVLRSETFAGTQGDLVSGSQNTDRFEALIDRLGARLGAERVRGFVGADTHIPERSFGTLPVIRMRGAAAAGSTAGALRVPPLTRPLWLMSRPEAIDVLAQVPDGAPMRFRWRKVGYVAARSEGPERIACEWWRDGRAAPTRDYFQVEARDGYRFWMFRHGLYDRERTAPRWYMQGVFA